MTSLCVLILLWVDSVAVCTRQFMLALLLVVHGILVAATHLA